MKNKTIHFRFDRKKRQLLQALGVSALATPLTGHANSESRARVVIVGGGFGGATAARTLRQLDPSLDLTLVDAKPHYTACPFSNLVIAGERSLNKQEFSWRALQSEGIKTVTAMAREIDTGQRRITFSNHKTVDYDKLILAPGIDFQWGAVEGYDQVAAALCPHAWQAGRQTILLRNQLTAMPDNGVVAISIPAAPYRCPPGPYERAGLIAHYLKQHKPRAKLLLLDAKDRFSKQPLFMAGWKKLYGDTVEWRGLSDSGEVRRVDAKRRELFTDFDSVQADVANVIPPQRAGLIAHRAQLTDNSGWCPVDPVTFESTLAQHVYVIGDAAIANAMPKSAFAANAQAKVCATQIVRDLAGLAPIKTTLINTCYSLLAPDYGISVAGVYEPGDTALDPVVGSGGTSKLDARPRTRRLEARYARSWFRNITHEAFGST